MRKSTSTYKRSIRGLRKWRTGRSALYIVVLSGNHLLQDEASTMALRSKRKDTSMQTDENEALELLLCQGNRMSQTRRDQTNEP